MASALVDQANIALIVVAGITLWLIRNGQLRTVLILLLTITTLLLVSTVITPTWFQPFFEEGFGRGLTAVLDGPDQVVAARINTTFPDWLRTLGVGSQARLLGYGIAICLGLAVFVRTVWHSHSLLELISVLLLVSDALTPYALQYDYPPLAIVLFWALSRCTLTPKALGIGCLLAGFIFSVLLWQQNISWAYWMVVGLIALAIWGRYQQTLRNREMDNKKTASM